MDNYEALAEVTEMIKSGSFSRQFQQIASLISEEPVNVKKMRSLAHGLKGSARGACCFKLADLAETLEKVEDYSSATAAKLVDQMEEEIASILKEIE